MVLFPFFRIRISGLNNIPQNGSFILMPKHQRWEEIPILGTSIERPLYYIAKHELFKNNISRWFISLLGGLPLNRKQPSKSRQSLEVMLRLLKKGEGVVIFPEGTYYRGRMGKGHQGLIRMIYSRLDTNFIPVGIKYSKKRWRTQVIIKIGEPIYGDSVNNFQEIGDYIMKEIARLSGL